MKVGGVYIVAAVEPLMAEMSSPQDNTVTAKSLILIVALLK